MEQRVIDANALKDTLIEIHKVLDEWISITQCDVATALARRDFCSEVIELIDNAPTVTPGSWSEGYHEGFRTGTELDKAFSRPKGEWIYHGLDNCLWGQNECPFCHKRSN